MFAQLVMVELLFHLVRQMSSFAARYSCSEEQVSAHVSLGDDFLALQTLMGGKVGANDWVVFNKPLCTIK
jgi:hypothetical protein